MPQIIGFIYVLLAGIGFGFLGIFARLAFQHGINVGELLVWRFVLASLILWISLLILKPRLVLLPIKQILISLALGCFGYSIFSTLYFMSIQGISVSLAALLLFTFPIFVNLGAHFFLNEKLKPLQLSSLILATLGITILVWGPLFVTSIKSVFYALAAAIAYSIYVLVSGKYQKGVQPLSSSLYVITSAAITLFLFHSPKIERILSFSSEEYLLIFGLATICTVAPLTFFLSGLQRLSSSKASIIVMVEPVVAAVAGWMVLHERLSSVQLVGAILVVIALVLNVKK
ncbi:MAG: DMT family transporter [Pseudobdellovibrio sp.]